MSTPLQRPTDKGRNQLFRRLCNVGRSFDLRAAVDAIRVARRTLGTIKANLFWAFAYNLAALPLAALGLLNPLIAGAAMALSSVFVVSNSLRLRRFHSSYSKQATDIAKRAPSGTTVLEHRGGRSTAAVGHPTASAGSCPESVVAALAHQRDPASHHGNGDRTQRIDHLQQLRAAIDAQLRDLQRP